MTVIVATMTAALAGATMGRGCEDCVGFTIGDAWVKLGVAIGVWWQSELSGGLQRHLSAIESFRVLFGRHRFHSSQPEDGPKHVFRKPVLVSLGLETFKYVSDFEPADLFVEVYEQIRLAQIAIILRDFVFQDKVLPEGVPGQVGKQSVILVPVVAAMGEDDVGAEPLFQILEVFLDFSRNVRKKTVAKMFYAYLFFSRTAQEGFTAADGLFPAFPVRAEHHPIEFQGRVLLEPAQDGPAATNLDIVAMGAETEDSLRTGAIGEVERQHEV
jgi:hypothetical protein